ncbi:PRSS21 isoform 6, partial [Pan troglodytes]
ARGAAAGAAAGSGWTQEAGVAGGGAVIRTMRPTGHHVAHRGWRGRRTRALAVAGEPAPVGFPRMRSEPAQPPLGTHGGALL